MDPKKLDTQIDRILDDYARTLGSIAEQEVLNRRYGSIRRKSRHGGGWSTLRLRPDGKAFSPTVQTGGRWITGLDGSPFWVPAIPATHGRAASRADGNGAAADADASGDAASGTDDAAADRPVPTPR